jgi:hypothetical protein
LRVKKWMSSFALWAMGAGSGLGGRELESCQA